jgi:hypothetical protein
VDLLHGKAIDDTLAEMRATAHQAQIMLASLQEAIANANELILKATRIADALSQAGKP